MSNYSRQDVIRILQISAQQLQAWERAGLIPRLESYRFQDLGHLRTLSVLRQEAVPAAMIRSSVFAMKAVAGMEYPLLETTVFRNGSRLLFRYDGSILDPITRQFLFDFERLDAYSKGNRLAVVNAIGGFKPSVVDQRSSVQARFLEAVQAEETGKKNRAVELYQELIDSDAGYAPAYINLGTLHFHQREFARAEELYRKATEIDPGYVLAFFDLGNVLDELSRWEESITAYRQAVELAPNYADAHYNLALAFERRGEWREALRHWQSYVRIDRQGPWAEHARGQIRMLLSREKLAIAWRAKSFVPRHKGSAALNLVACAEYED